MLRILTGLLFAAALVSCETPDITVDPAPDPTGPASQTVYERINFEGEVATPEERALCEAAGGEVRPAGLRGWENCIQTYSDAGAPCMDGSDCEGRCLVTEGSPDFGEKTDAGRCQATDSLFGCFQEVVDGRAQPGLCVD